MSFRLNHLVISTEVEKSPARKFTVFCKNFVFLHIEKLHFYVNKGKPRNETI